MTTREVGNVLNRVYGLEKVDCRRRTSRLPLSKVREALFEKLGQCCVRCGYSDKRALQFDHVNSDGKELRRKHKGSKGSWRAALESGDLSGLQILCANCNTIKKIEMKEDVGKASGRRGKSRLHWKVRERLLA